MKHNGSISTCAPYFTLEMELPSSSESNAIKKGDGVVLRKDTHLKYVKAYPGRKERMGNCNFFLDKMIGREFGMAYEVKGNQLVNIDPLKYEREDVDCDEQEEKRDNRSLNDDSKAQKLSKDDIMSLKSEGVGGEDIIEKIKDSSATFKEKTVYSQAKYLKKKKKKHLTYFTTCKPTTRLLSQLYFAKAPSKILDMRPDTVGQILAWSDVKYGSKVLIAETCQGLVLGAVLERLGGKGKIVHVYNGNCPVRIILNQFNFSDSEKSDILCGFSFQDLEEIKSKLDKNLNEEAQSGDVQEEKEKEINEGDICMEEVEKSDNILSVPSEVMEEKVEKSDKILSLPSEVMEEKVEKSDDILPVPSEVTEVDESRADNEGTKTQSNDTNSDSFPCNKYYTKEKKDSEEAAAISHLAEKDLDALIIATKFYPLNILAELIGFLRPSSPVLIYCQYREPLMDCYEYLRGESLAVNVHLSETWLREWQVLKDRSHPKMVMSGRSGYLLRGIKIVPPEERAVDNLEPVPKLPKL